MGWTIKGQPAGKYKPKTTRRASGLTTIVERNLWKIVKNAIKTKKIKAKKRGRFIVYN
jgi:hypothetical protein